MSKEDGEEYTREPLRTGCGIGVVFGAIAGGLSAGLLFTTSFKMTADWKSTDFLGAVLSALGALMGLVSVLLALVALALAVAAFFGWHEIKRRTDEKAAETAAKVAHPVAEKAVTSAEKAAVAAAVPEAIYKVEEYLDRLSPQVRSEVAVIVARTLTPEFLQEIANQANKNARDGVEGEVENDSDFSAKVVKKAAAQERVRQERGLEELDADFEADAYKAGVDDKLDGGKGVEE